MIILIIDGGRLPITAISCPCSTGVISSAQAFSSSMVILPRRTLSVGISGKVSGSLEAVV